jgi:hypothetical protein
MEMVKSNSSSLLHYATNPARVWSDYPSRPFRCALRHWALEQAPMFAILLLIALFIAIVPIRRRRYKQRVQNAISVFKEALNILKGNVYEFRDQS